jgi:imidazole glycerol-phosphate synthase subunit HisH
MIVGVIDYGMGNLGSVCRAFEECGAKVDLVNDPKALNKVSHLILPGVGSFYEGMKRIREGNWDQKIHEMTRDKQIPLLGICLGMQLLMDIGTEGGETTGLGLIPGKVVKMNPVENERLPHVGWNEVCYSNEQEHSLLKGIPSSTDFYFVHSFHVKCDSSEHIIATTPFAGGVTSIIAKNNVIGVQFHPEKSQKPGFQIIRNFLSI